MNWKRVGRSLVCLLVVAALLINLVPQKAEATGLGMAAGAGAVLAAPSLPVIAAVLLGLGVLVGVATTDWDAIARDCQMYLQNEGIIDEEGNIDILAIDGVAYAYGVTQNLIEKIRDWLFEEEIVASHTSSKLSGFTVNRISNPGSNLAFYQSPYWQACLYNAYFDNSAIIVGCYSSYMWGWFWDGSGQLMTATWENPLGSTHASVLGLYPLSDLVCLKTFAPSTSAYFSKSVAEAQPSFLLSTCFAFDWGQSNDKEYFKFFCKEAYNSTWNPSTERRDCIMYGNVYMPYTNNAMLTYFPSSVDDIVWNVTDDTYLSSDYDVTLGEVAPSDAFIFEGYASWYSNAIAVPGETVGNTEDDYIPVWPIGLGKTYEETQKLTQEQVWAGESTYEDTTTGVITGTFADTAVGTFINSLVNALMTPLEWLLDGIKAIFVPSEDFLTAKVEALRSNFKFADSIITTGESLRSAFREFETSPPIIYMELANSESQIDWGDRAIALDLRWYERYKPTVDTLLSALLWIWFIWRVFRKLPGIISGMPGDVPNAPVPEGPFLGYGENQRRLPGGTIKRR